MVAGESSSWHEATLVAARLHGTFGLANFTGADLTAVDGGPAVLTFANFTNAFLVGADLTEAEHLSEGVNRP